MSKNKVNYFEINSNKRLRLSDIPVTAKPAYKSDEKYNELLLTNHALIEESQILLYAEHQKSLIIIFQGMDTSGKDGAIKHVMSGVNPQGCSVMSFKAPSTVDLEHDFLWRTNHALPAHGQIGIFNRSYYEEALVTRVHPELLDAEKLPTSNKYDRKFWKNRFSDIENYESYLGRQGYEIIKIFIHISKTEQKKRLLDRFQNPKKLWKISSSDIRERKFWKEYQSAYEQCIQNTATQNCPWYIVPGDDKRNARLIISQILVDRFKQMDLRYPELKPEEKRKLKALKALLAKD